MSSFGACAQTTRELNERLQELESRVSLLEIPPLAGREWYELLRHKLLPQLGDDTYLVVAVVGGTNIGKSVVFNHLAGSRASATSPLASGTKHPVCLVPSGFSERHDLETVFPGFVLTEWNEGVELEEDASHRLFWHTSDQLPDNLLVLDTPDIDSDAQVNWTRADNIRHCADVLIAVHTQQKYNDAAVKQFFRKAAAEDKAVIVIFNQCQLPEDDEIWPIWLTTFTDETGIQPEIVYVAPNNRQAAETNQLPFFERQWPLGEDNPIDENSHNLCDDLARLRFNDIKLRSLAGSLNHLLAPEAGVTGYLNEIAESSKRREAAVALLDEQELVQSKCWPSVPNNLLVPEIRNWWQAHRVGWPKHIRGFYDKLGTGITWSLRTVKHKLTGEPPAPEEVYRLQEWETILDIVHSAFDGLRRLADLGDPLIRDRIEPVLAGRSRADVIAHLKQAHKQIDFEQLIGELVNSQMLSFQRENPKFYRFLSQLDKVATAARPVTSVALFLTGLGPAGDLAAQAVSESAIQIAGEVASGTATVAVGEAALGGASAGIGRLEAWFRRLHTAFAMQRAEWMYQLLTENLWGSLATELQDAAALPESEIYRHVQQSLQQLRQQVAQALAPTT